MAELAELVHYVATLLAHEPEKVFVQEDHGMVLTTLTLFVAPDDVGHLIGKQGRTINALRALARVLAAKQGRKVQVEVVADEMV